jgi:hypothetical protein
MQPDPLPIAPAAKLATKTEAAPIVNHNYLMAHCTAPIFGVPPLPPVNPPAPTTKAVKRQLTKPIERKQKQKVRRKSSLTPTPSFPAILMGMLSTPQNSEYITFLKDKNRFVVLDASEFESKVLPMHFEPTGASSMYGNFTLMLDEWGFKTGKDDEFPGKDVYSHPMFKEGDWEGCLKITKPGSKSIEAAKLEYRKPSPPPKTAASTILPEDSQMKAPDAQSLAVLNASLSKHMSATETSRVLCNRYGLLNDSSKLQAMMAAQAQQNESSALQAMLAAQAQAQQNEASALGALQAMIATQAQQNESSALPMLAVQAQQNDSSALGALQAMLVAQAQQNDSSVLALQAILAAQAQQNESSALQAILAAQDPSTLQAILAAHQAQTLHPHAPRTISPEFSAILGNASSLDVMAERFIKQSVERMMNRQVMRSHMNQGFGSV